MSLPAISIHVPRFVLAVGALSLFCCTAGCGKRGAKEVAIDQPASLPDPHQNQGPPPEHRPIAVTGDGFVASDSCKDCHADQYATWHASYHRRMTQVASPDAVIGDFANKAVRAYGRTFNLSTRDQAYWVTMHDPSREVTQDSPLIERQIALTTGSHHMQIYWYLTGEQRNLAQLPVAWLKETQSWVPTSSLFISPPPQPMHVGKQRWNETCIKCHTTHGQPRIDKSNSIVDTQVGEFGISCEACHGPGETHVAEQSAEQDGKTDSGNRMVHPDRLSHQRASQVCGQCHGNWLPKNDTELAKFIWAGNSFRAGDELAETGHVFGCGMARSQFIQDFVKQRPNYFADRFWSDGMIRVSGGEYNGLAQSACFQRGTMSCLSCHQMHPETNDPATLASWTTDQLDPELQNRDACLQCHSEFRDEAKLKSHTFHSVSSTGSDCYNCHMPHTTYGLLKAIRSHQISIPRASDTATIGRPNACNQCHLDETLAWTADHLSEWYGMENPKLSEDQRKYASSVLQCLTGDAGQRALAAWSLGWAPAQEASGTAWMPPVLAQLLADPYDAVRHVAHRSMKTLPGFSDFAYEFTGPKKTRQTAAIAAFRLWAQQPTTKSFPGNRSVLVEPGGRLMQQEFSRLNHLRDNRQVLLAE